MSELLDAVQGSPILLAVVVIVGSAVYAVEKLGGIDGPLTRLVRSWQERELRRLRRRREAAAARRQIEQESDDARVVELTTEVEWLLRQARDQRRRDRVRDQHERQLVEWLGRLLTAARRAGVQIDDPPEVPYLAPLFVEDDEPPSTRPLRQAGRNSARALPPPR